MSINIQAKSDYSTLFASMNSNSSSSSGTSNLYSLLSDYGTIKSGAYGKLMRAYYGAGNTSESGASNIVKKTQTVDESVKAYNQVSTDADALQKSLSSLEKVDASDAEASYKALKTFTEDYNSLLSSSEKADSTSINNRIDSMKSNTKAYESQLNKLGISVGSDGKLSINKDTAEASDRSNMDTLFASRGSFGYSTTVSAAMIQSNASYAASSESTYTQSGTYTNTTGSLWDSFT